MKQLYVLYDPDCGLCLQAREWVEAQAHFVETVFLAAGTEEAARLFPALTVPGRPPEELVVIDEDGGVYRGGEGWVLILWALVEYRPWALRLATPALLPLARNFFHAVSVHRQEISTLLRWSSDRQIAENLAAAPPVCVPGQQVRHSSRSVPPGGSNLLREFLV